VLTTGFLGRVSGWTAVVLGVLGLVVVATALSPDANPMPFMLGLLWILVTSTRLAWRGPRRATATTATSDAPAAALL
jgi:hypothetical protein